MIRALPYKTKQFFFALIKLSIVVGAAYFCYTKLTENPDLNFHTFWNFLIEKQVFTLKNGLILLALTILNWIFEILKWQQLVSYILPITFFEATKQSLAALTASLITPNRIGDYAAKAVYFKKGNRTKILLMNLLANINQMSVTTLFGVIGLVLFWINYDLDVSPIRLGRFAVVVALVGFLSLFGIRQTNFKFRGFHLLKIVNYLKKLPSNLHLKIGMFSLIRYLIFSFQFYMLLTLFGVEVSYYKAMIVISSMYLLASIIPTFFVLDVIVKGSIAAYLFGVVGVNAFTILSIITVMWILNFMLPSAIGSFYVLRFKNYQGFPSKKDAS